MSCVGHDCASGTLPSKHHAPERCSACRRAFWDRSLWTMTGRMICGVMCPKCRVDVPAGAECPQCGIVFSRYRERDAPRAPELLLPAGGRNAEACGAVTTLLCGIESPPSRPAAIGRGVFLLLLCMWTMTLVSRAVSVQGSDSFLNLPNLVFHEAGHILFAPFGRFMTVLGGSLTQVLIPLVCAATMLWSTRDAFGAAVSIWWAGQSLTGVATYVNDARNLQLVLLGGRTGAEVEGHDWEVPVERNGCVPPRSCHCPCRAQDRDGRHDLRSCLGRDSGAESAPHSWRWQSGALACSLWAPRCVSVLVFLSVSLAPTHGWTSVCAYSKSLAAPFRADG